MVQNYEDNSKRNLIVIFNCEYLSVKINRIFCPPPNYDNSVRRTTTVSRENSITILQPRI